MRINSPEPDVFEQQQPVDPDDDLDPVDLDGPLEADPLDAADQHRSVALDDDARPSPHQNAIGGTAYRWWTISARQHRYPSDE